MNMDEKAEKCLGRKIERSEEHTSELQSQSNIVCRLLLEKKKVTRPSELYRTSRRSLLMLYLLTRNLPPITLTNFCVKLAHLINRYEIEEGAPGWRDSDTL